MKSIYLILVTALLFFSCADKNSKQQTEEVKKESQSETTQNQQTAKKPQENQVLQNGERDKILGSWLRPDGGYILEIKKFSESSFEAAYYNPKSIYVSETEWKIQDGYVYLFIKFDDEGYPGSYYSLGYYPEKDMLIGFYYQAVAKQKFDVYFEREN